MLKKELEALLKEADVQHKLDQMLMKAADIYSKEKDIRIESLCSEIIELKRSKDSTNSDLVSISQKEKLTNSRIIKELGRAEHRIKVLEKALLNQSIVYSRGK